jgi:uncharacterized protein (UPF0335 family)
MGLPGGSDGLDHVVTDRLQDWVVHFEKLENVETAAIVREIKDGLSDIPF